MQIPALLAERGYSLRAAHDNDIPWLRDLYASTRREEMSQVPWLESAKRLFTDQQFLMQHQHYILHHPNTDFLIIEYDHAPVGRYYLQKGTSEILVVDISLLPEHTGQGIGSTLLRQTQMDAHTQGSGVRLHVNQNNSNAQRLYEKLGFVAKDTTATHIAMHWQISPQ